MPELIVVEKLQPCLLDRLADDDPKNSQESRTQRVISLQRYRDGVLRDLRWIFNASAHLPNEGAPDCRLEDFPEARKSVINFGVRHLFGQLTPNLRELERQLVEAVSIYEPRIVRESLKIRSRREGGEIILDLTGELWAIPIPEQLHIKTRLDLDTGHCSLGV